jgi:glutathione S-transferase
MIKLGESNETRVDQLKEQLNDKLDVYDKILSKQSYLAGDVFTLADLFHLPYGSWLVKVGEEDLFNSRPNVKKWWDRITSRSSWKTVQSMA